MTAALLVGGSFAVMSSLYIVFSDTLVAQLVSDPQRYQEWQSIKGLGFVVTVSVGLGLVVYTLLRRLERANRITQSNREKLLLMERRVLAGTLAATIVHDAKNLSGAIRANLQYLQQTLEPRGNAAEALKDSLEAVDALVALNTRLQRAARDQISETPVRVDMSKLVATAVGLVETHEKLRSCQLEVVLPESLPARVHPNLVTHAVINLVLNAAAEVGARGIIRVSLTSRDDAPMRVIVEDNGPGIPPDKRQAVLQPFTSEAPEGTGLGLFSVAYCMTEHHGRVIIDDSELGGARICLQFDQLGPQASTSQGTAPTTGALMSGDTTSILPDA